MGQAAAHGRSGPVLAGNVPTTLLLDADSAGRCEGRDWCKTDKATSMRRAQMPVLVVQVRCLSLRWECAVSRPTSNVGVRQELTPRCTPRLVMLVVVL